MKLVGPLNSGPAVGGDGEATAHAATPLPLCGYVIGLYVRYNGDPPAGTTDVVVKTVGTAPAPPSLTLLSLSNGATGGWFWPRVPIHQASDGAPIDEQYDYPALADLVDVLIAGANADDSVDVWLLMDGD